jgi:hypothetical protein
MIACAGRARGASVFEKGLASLRAPVVSPVTGVVVITVPDAAAITTIAPVVVSMAVVAIADGTGTTIAAKEIEDVIEHGGVPSTSSPG